MIAFSGLRPAIVVSQVVLTFGAAQLAGFAAAGRYQQDQDNTAKASIASADMAFDAQTQRAISDGTPQAAVDPLLAMRKRLQDQVVPGSKFFVDRLRIDALNKRAADTQALTRQLAATETQVEVTLHQQLVAAVKALRDGVDAAKAAGVDPADDAAFADATEKAHADLSVPRLEQQAINEVNSRGDTLAHATSARIAARLAAAETARQAALALEYAKSSAQSALQAAQAALARVQAIPVLKVTDNQAAITGLSQSLSQDLASNAPAEQFRTVAQGLRDQAASLNDLVNTRQATYDLEALTRRELDAAQAAKNDVTAERAQVDALAPQLDAAGDLGAITKIKNQVQAIKNAIDSKYLAALYGVGKVIVISTDQERLVALQDGVVVLNTLVTTGRPSLPTVLGTFHIFYKDTHYHMCTPPQWRGTRYDYGCVMVPLVMEFESSGYFIHDAPWRSHYGPGSDTENGGTHGCVNVQETQMQWLYSWTPMGTPVITRIGDIPS